ncbi:MAG TPA: hypothetical protein VKQ54_16975 [Caulobacteraceae bacterium]|nr:hypothetical protein [Caulobacteraceae bacterium]
MDNQTLLIIVAAVVVAVLVGGFLYARNRRSSHLRSRFGPQYDRAVEERGGRGKAEADLHKLEKRVSKFDIRPLSATERDRFVSSWRDIQANFVDNPETAVTRADQLLGEVMLKRGYPVGDFEQQAADLSVDHPVVVENYRAAHEIALRHGRGQSNTEDLRQAMIHFRTLFDELASDRAITPAEARSPPADRKPAPAQ